MKKFRLLTILCLAFIMLFSFGFATTAYFRSAYADTEASDPSLPTVQVNFYVGGHILLQYKLNQGQLITKPTGFCEDAADLNWTKEGSVIPFDFSTETVGSQNIKLNLTIETGKQVVFFTRKNPRYASGSIDPIEATEYRTYYISIVPNGGTVSAPDYNPLSPETDNTPDIDGYNFARWGTSADAEEAFPFATQAINSNTMLYPIYTIKTFNVEFLVDSDLYDQQTINYKGIIAAPARPTKDGYVFSHWYVQGTDPSTAFSFSTEVTDNYVLIAQFRSAQLAVTFNTLVSGTILNAAETATNGVNYTFDIQLNENYDNFNLTEDNISISGSKTTYTVESTDTKGLFTVTVVNPTSDLVISFLYIEINQYTIQLSYTNGLDIEIPSSVNYTMSGSNYVLDFNSEFAFKVSINPNYEMTSASISVASSCEWDDLRECYFITDSPDYKNKDLTITVNATLVECVNITFSGIEDLEVNMLDTSNIIKEESGLYRVKKNQYFTFTAKEANEETHKIKTTGVAMNYGTYYRVDATEDLVVEFVVIETVDFLIPQQTVGIARIDVQNQVGGGTESTFYKYRVEKDTDLQLTFVLEEEYSAAILELSTYNGGEIDTTNYPVVIVKNISSRDSLNIVAPSKNSYLLTLVNNAMAELNCGETRITHGTSAVINVTRANAYNKTKILPDNLTIIGEYTGVTISEDSSTITISGVSSALSVAVEGLSKNKYAVSLIVNTRYGELTPTTPTAEHATSFTFMVKLNAAYSKTIISKSIFQVTSQATNAPLNYEMIVTGSNVIVQNVLEDINISFKELTLNRYTMRTPNAEAGKYTVDSEDTNVEHGSEFTFTITLTEPYSKSAQTMTVVQRIASESVTVIPQIDGRILTYTITNVNTDLIFQVSPIELNIYTVDFRDPSTEESYGTRRVTHGQGIPANQQPSAIAEGSSFLGWCLDKEGTVPFNTDSVFQDIICYANFAVIKKYVTFKVDGEVLEVKGINYGQAITDYPTIPNKEGYDNAYWKLNGIPVNSIKQDYTIEAEYIINVYEVIFRSDETIFSRQEIQHGSAATNPGVPTKKGHSFQHWDKSYTNVTSNLVINAVYKIYTYTVRFFNARQSNTEIVNFAINYGEKIIEPVQSGTDRSKYIFSYRDLDDYDNIHSAERSIDTGYVLEGWYTDEHLSLKYNFNDIVDLPNNGDELHIYGNMEITKILVDFYVNNEFYTQKSVDYMGTLTNIPSVPAKVGYDQQAPYWKIEGPRTNFTNLTADMRVDAVYTVNTYTVKFVFPGGEEEYSRQVTHGASVTNVPLPVTTFGQILIYDREAYKYVTGNKTIYIKVFNLLPYLIGAAGAAVLILVIVGLGITIATIKRNKQDTKKMEQLIKDIRAQDKRLTEIQERKLRAQVDAEMMRKEKINKNKFLE